MQRQRPHLYLLTFIAMAVALSYFYFVVPDCLLVDPNSCFTDWNTTPTIAPFRYRVAQPLIEYALNPAPTTNTLLWTDVGLQALLSIVTIAALYKWLLRWQNEDRALLGVALFAIAYIIAFHFYQRALHTSIELACLTLFLAFSGQRWHHILFGTAWVIVASLNRETSLLLPASFIALYTECWRSTRFRLIAGFYVGLWVAITAGLHIVLGSAPHQLGLMGTFEYNAAHLFDGILTNLIFIPFGVVVVLGYRSASPVLKRLLVVAGIYVLAMVVGSSWRESQRLILPALPLLLPLMLATPSAPFTIAFAHPDPPAPLTR